MQNIYLFVDVVIVIGLLSLAGASFIKDGYKNVINRLFAVFSIMVALWIISNYVSNDLAMPNQVAIYADYIVFSSSFGASVILAELIVKLANARNLGLLTKRLMPVLFIIWATCFTPLIVAGVEPGEHVYSIIFGPLIWLYGVGLFVTVALIVYGLFYGLKHSVGTRKKQLIAINLGLIIAMPLVMIFSFIIPVITGNFAVTEFGISPLLILVICLYYGVVKYGLFDIRLAAVRTLAYILSLVSLSVVYYYLAYIVSMVFFHGSTNSSVSVSPVDIALALLLAFIFQPVKRFFDKITNSVFYKDNYNTDDFFGRLNKALAVTTDLRSLLERAAYEIGHTLKAEQAFFFINTDNGHYVSAGTQNHKQLPKADAAQIAENYNVKDGVIAVSLLDSGNMVRRLMLSHRIELVLPLTQDNKTIGYLCLGDHLNSGYTNRDIKVLKTISNELVIAIQNALAVEEIRDLNATLQQRINNATKELRASNAILRELDKVKDEFVSMASHQLRTPLTSVKGYLSMVIEGDAGKITKSQRNLLDEAFSSSERMVHLINDFLNVSRIQTGKFIIDKTPVDLSQLVKQEIDQLQPNADSRNMKFAYKAPKKFPIVNVDEGKIRQVVMNFADNAIYYSHEGTTISVDLSVQGNCVAFTVKDTGIGVPVAERAHLFTKFFRAGNARKQRPDGTGVGLYLAKKVIDAHGGKIIFESVENKGSTFGFCLPIE